MKDPFLEFFEAHEGKEDPTALHLAHAPLCDFSDAALQALKERLFKPSLSPVRQAERVYDFIRQKILYGFDEWEVKASQTFAKGWGMCFNKSNLMIALLRAMQVPCLYAAFWIRREGFRFTADPKMFQKISPLTVHLYVEAYVGDRIGWRRYVDTSLDADLRRILEKKGYQPYRNIVLEKPIVRFAAPEEVLEWRRDYKKEMGLSDSITFEEMEISNEQLKTLRREGRS